MPFGETAKLEEDRFVIVALLMAVECSLILVDMQDTDEEIVQDSQCLFAKLCCCLYLGSEPMPGANYPEVCV